MEKINLVSASGIKIEVNDKGDYITINLADRTFPKRFANAFDNIKKRYAEINQAKLPETDALALLDVEIETGRFIAEEIDRLIGAGTCQKVFGDIVPDMYAITEFFEQLVPIIQKCGRERNAQIRSKYSAGRRGNR